MGSSITFRDITTTQVDIFSGVYDEEKGKHTSVMWLNNGDLATNCTYPMEGKDVVCHRYIPHTNHAMHIHQRSSLLKGWTKIKIWENKIIRVPVPVETILVTMYGQDWRVPKDWVWYLDPYK